MLVGLGFVLALLASLVTTRLAWLYLARRKALQQRRMAPVSQAAQEAERDRLRVENAMLQNRLIHTEKNLKQQLAERMAQAARYRNKLDAAHAEIMKLRQAQPLAARLSASSPAEEAAEARLRSRLENLTELANKIELQRKRLRRRGKNVNEDSDVPQAQAQAAELKDELQSHIRNLKANPTD